jgi:diguanylate cyclase (GGDEF)-like protein
MKSPQSALPASIPSSSERRHALVAWVILAVGLIASIALTIGVRHQVQQEAKHQFEADSRDVLYRVQTEIGSYEEVLVGLSAFLRSKEHVSRAEFRRYVEGLDLSRRFPGFDNLNYAELVPASELNRFQQSVRMDTSVHPEGYPTFVITSSGPRAEYNVIVFVEPWDRSPQAFGKDISAAPGVGGDLARMRDSGEIATSGRLIRIQGADRRVGLAMRLAVYRPGATLDSVEERHAAFRGSVGAGYRIADLLRAAVSLDQLHHMRFRLFDQGMDGKASGPAEDRLIFDSVELVAHNAEVKNDELETNLFESRRNFTVGGRIWQIQFTAPMQPPGIIGRVLPWLALIAGLTTTLLLFGLFRSFATSRRRAEALANAITRDLAESEASLAAAQQIAKLGNWSLSPRDGSIRWSDEALRLLDVAADEPPANVEAFMDCVHPEDRERVRHAIANCIAHSAAFDIEHRILVGSGERWVHGLGESRLSADGDVEMIRGTIMDISERKLGARRNEIEVALARLFASARPTAETMSDALGAICAECGFESGRYWENDADGPTRRCAQWGELGSAGTFDLIEAAALNGGDNWLARAWRTGGVHKVESAGAIVLPLVAGDKRLGAIGLFGRGADSLQHDLVKLLEGVVAQVAQYLMRRRAEDNFKHLATHDPLTGLPNRLLFGERVSEAIARSERSQRGLAVLFVDLDRFKNVNDTLGHGAGDAVLKACAERLARSLRDTDLIARISGDEFAVLVEPCAQPAAAIAVARKILNAIERPLIVQGQEIVLTGSIGISIYHEDGRDAETLLKHSDIAMFKAKENGRNNYQFYSAQMNPHSLQRLGLEAALRRALDRDEFTLHYQPKFDLRSGDITGVEALLRWRHAELGMVSPAQFIPIAEETGLIEPIGAWVLKEACTQGRRWFDDGLQNVRIAVNLSARQFRNQRLCRDIRKCLSETNLDPRLLELELTESMVMQDPEMAATMLKELKWMGLGLSIDDFGTGYSSLAYLKRFPIDSVKVDRSFVKDIPGNAEDAAIVEAVIALAHSLRLRVVAEGVETAEQKEYLKTLGCDEMQGYFASKPLPVEDATRFLEAHFRKEGRKPGRAPLSIVT